MCHDVIFFANEVVTTTNRFAYENHRTYAQKKKKMSARQINLKMHAAILS